MLLPPFSFIGIDYGAKLAGTTVLVYYQDGCFRFLASTKGQDADLFLEEKISELRPDQVFIDAPLSLPGVYRSKALQPEADFFYRKADREVRAMSPLFLGGLTARAMRLKAQNSAVVKDWLEVYPAYLAKILELKSLGYKKDMARMEQNLQALSSHLPSTKVEPVPSWHHFDALLAWLSGLRFQQNQHLSFGDQEEGMILV